MAVIESKGNGYSLFNGVKLPSLPEWDKETYPYAVMVENVQLFFSTVPYNYLPDTDRMFVDGGLRTIYKLVDGVWNLVREGNENLFTSFTASGNSLWVNYDVINTTDNSVYLAASEPISLDGMNVIEWDGDTEGLLSVSGRYRVSAAVDADVTKGGTYVIMQQEKPTTATYTPTDVGDHYYFGGNIHYAPKAGETYSAEGLYFLKNALRCVSLLAYYPIPHIIESKGDGYALYNGEKVLASEVPEGAEAISLDGMNVIEWDGDTTGLLSAKSDKLWHVSDATDVDTSRGYVSVRLSTGATRVVYQEDAYNWNENDLVYAFTYQGRIVPEANETFAAAGVWFFQTASSISTSLFAYYPIKSGASIGRKFLLHEIFEDPIIVRASNK